jgi:hypothetical protein
VVDAPQLVVVHVISASGLLLSPSDFTTHQCMRKPLYLPYLFLIGGSGLVSCESSVQPSLPSSSRSTTLEGAWQQDSSRGRYYTPHHTLLSSVKSVGRKEENVTITPTRWRYPNYHAQEHRFTRYTGKLLVQQYPIGEENGRADTLDILVLSTHHLVLRDSSNGNPDGSINVWRHYYSR